MVGATSTTRPSSRSPTTTAATSRSSHNVGNTSAGPTTVPRGRAFRRTARAPTATAYTYGPNFPDRALRASIDWYIGNNGRAAEGGRSLYRVRLGSGAVPRRSKKSLPVVSDMQVLYRVSTSNSFVAATRVAAADWVNVNAMQVTPTVDECRSARLHRRRDQLWPPATHLHRLLHAQESCHDDLARELNACQAWALLAPAAVAPRRGV